MIFYKNISINRVQVTTEEIVSMTKKMIKTLLWDIVVNISLITTRILRILFSQPLYWQRV